MLTASKSSSPKKPITVESRGGYHKPPPVRQTGNQRLTLREQLQSDLDLIHARHLQKQRKGPAQRNRKSQKRDRANALLQRELAGGPKTLDHLSQIAESEGISPSTLRAAKEELGVKAKRQGKGKGEGLGTVSLWSLPGAE